MTTVKTLLERIRPFILTMEETDNLGNHAERLASIITDITSYGYSVAWKVDNVRYHGASTRRKRFSLVVACPGVPLPPFPERTHGFEGSGLQSFATVGDALTELLLHSDATHHDESTAVSRDLVPYEPWDVQAPCITTKGSGTGGKGKPIGSYHPSGEREFTIRELAVLQGFPVDFDLGPEGLKNKGALVTGIGNSVSPLYSRALYEKTVRVALDGMEVEASGTATI